MKAKEFPWDKHLATARYADILANSPELGTQRPPTQYSPDGRWIYLSSLDDDCETDDLEGLQQLLDAVSDRHTACLPKKDYSKLHKLRVDCIEICRLISRLADDPESYADPDGWLEKGAATNATTTGA